MKIQDHKYAWRWTDERFAKFPEDVLARMVAFDETRAGQAHEESLAFLSGQGLSAAFHAVAQTETHGLSNEAGQAWLNRCGSQPDVGVTLSWQIDAALSTSFGIFTKYWSDFCFPGADDLVVWPGDGCWVLLYHHEERFELGVRI